MDKRATVAFWAMVAVVVGVGLIVHYAQPWGGLLVGAGIAGWIALLGTQFPQWDLHDAVAENPPIELVTFMKTSTDETVLWVMDHDA